MTDYWVDSHCHLNYKGLADRTDEVVGAAEAAGVGCMLSINTKLREYDEVLALTERYSRVYGSVGVHPHEAETEQGTAAEAIVARTKTDKIVGIGETGLDYYYDNAPRDLQKANFYAHIEAAQDTGLPLIIHTRDADEDCAQILTDTLKKAPYKPLIHCFTASSRFADQVLEMGAVISFSGIVTFKSARDLQAIAARVPEDRILVETDSPFLAPVPLRGKICEPGYVIHTAKFLAELRGQSEGSLRRSTTRNFFALFDKAVPPPELTTTA